MQIGTLANEAGVGVETIRFYERKGLIARPPRPRDGGFRSYAWEFPNRSQAGRQAWKLARCFFLSQTLGDARATGWVFCPCS